MKAVDASSILSQKVRSQIVFWAVKSEWEFWSFQRPIWRVSKELMKHFSGTGFPLITCRKGKIDHAFSKIKVSRYKEMVDLRKRVWCFEGRIGATNCSSVCRFWRWIWGCTLLSYIERKGRESGSIVAILSRLMIYNMTMWSAEEIIRTSITFLLSLFDANWYSFHRL